MEKSTEVSFRSRTRTSQMEIYIHPTQQVGWWQDSGLNLCYFALYIPLSIHSP